MIDKVFACVDQRLEEYKEFLKQVITMESYTPDKAAVDRLGGYIKEYAEAHGFHVHVEPFEKAGNGLLITANEDAPLPPVAFTGHMDTVFPEGTFAKPVFREENGRFYGPGVTDMKGGIVVALLAMQALKDAGYQDRPLKLILIGDEELSEGLSGEAGKDFIRESARGCAAAITTEGGIEDHVTVGRKGSIRYRVHVTGRAAHAGIRYSDGISAIKEAAHKVLAIESASDQEQITYNCGLLSGGTSPNTVPEHCEFTLYNRYWKLEQRQEIRNHVEGIIEKSFIPGTHSTFEIIGERPPMEDTPENYALFEQINSAALKYGFTPRKAGKQAGGSDAAYTSMVGVPSVCSMGLRGDRVHSTDEYAEVSSLADQAKLIAATVVDLPADFGVKK